MNELEPRLRVNSPGAPFKKSLPGFHSDIDLWTEEKISLKSLMSSTVFPQFHKNNEARSQVNEKIFALTKPRLRGKKGETEDPRIPKSK